MALTVSGEGADLTPTEFIADMVEKAPELSELYPYVRKIPVTSDTGIVPKEGSAITVRWGRTEANAMTASTPTYGQVAYTAQEFYAFCEVSYQLLADSPVAVAADVARQFRNALLAEQDKVIAIGNTSSSQPQGIASATITQSVSISNSLTYAGLVSIENQLPAKYRRNARWIGHTKVIDTMRHLKDDNGRPIFTASLQGGAPDRILGYPFSRQDDLPLTDLWLGDLERYYWFDRMSLSLDSDSGGKYFEAGTTAHLGQVIGVVSGFFERVEVGAADVAKQVGGVGAIGIVAGRLGVEIHSPQAKPLLRKTRHGQRGNIAPKDERKREAAAQMRPNLISVDGGLQTGYSRDLVHHLQGMIDGFRPRAGLADALRKKCNRIGRSIVGQTKPVAIIDFSADAGQSHPAQALDFLASFKPGDVRDLQPPQRTDQNQKGR